MMEKINRNHISTIFFNTISKGIIVLLPMALKIKKSEDEDSLTILLVVCLVLIGLILACNYLKWYKTTFEFEENLLIVNEGIFVKKQKKIPYEKIQTCDMTQSIKYKILNLVELKIDSGNVSSEEIEMHVIVHKNKAEEIKSIIFKEKVDPLLKIDETAKEFIKIKTLKLIVACITDKGVQNGFIFLLAVHSFIIKYIFGIFHLKSSLIEKFNDYTKYKNMSDKLIIRAVLILGTISIIIAIIRGLIKYNNFITTRIDNNIVITYGMFEKKQFTMPVNKISAVYIKQNWVRQLFNIRAIHIETIGYGNEHNESTMICPIAIGNEYKIIIKKLLPEFYFEDELIKAKRQTKIKFIFPKLMTSVILVFIISRLLIKYNYDYPVAWSVLIGMVLLSIISGFLEYKNTAISKTEKLMCLSNNGFNKEITIIPIEKIQSFKINQNYLQKKLNIFNYIVYIQRGSAGGGIKVKNMEHY